MPEKSNELSNSCDPIAIAEKAHVLSLQIEQGQATKPCSDAFMYLKKNLNANLKIAFLCLSETAMSSVTEDLNAMGMVADSRVDGGFSGKLNELSVLVVTIDEISPNQAAWRTYAAESAILVIATDAQAAMEDKATSALIDLARSFPVALIWVTDHCCQSEDDRNRNDDQPLQPANLKTLRRSQVGLSELIDADNQKLRSLGSGIQECRSCEWLTTALGNLTGRCRREASRLDSQSKAITSVKPPTSKPTVSKGASTEKEGARLKESVTTLLIRIDKELSLKSERSIQPLGKWPGLVREIAFGLAVEDLESTHTPSATRLTVNAGHLAKINRQIEHALRQEMTSDIGRVNRQVDQVVDELFPEYDKIDAAQAPAMPVLKDSAIWPSVENLIAVGKVFDIELVRKGFFDVLTAGRQKVFMVIMFVSLMGRMGLPDLFQSGSAKVMFGVFMAAVMIGSMINSILLWRSEKQAQSERELAKIRDTIFNEALKIVEQVEKAKLAAVREFLKEINLKIEIEAGRQIEASSIQQKSISDDELRKKDLLTRGLETRLKLVTEVERHSEKLGELVQNGLDIKKKSMQNLLTNWIESSNVDADMANSGNSSVESSSCPALKKPAAEPVNSKPIENRAKPNPTVSRSSGLLERRRLREEASPKESSHS